MQNVQKKLYQNEVNEFSIVEYLSLHIGEANHHHFGFAHFDFISFYFIDWRQVGIA